MSNICYNRGKFNHKINISQQVSISYLLVFCWWNFQVEGLKWVTCILIAEWWMKWTPALATSNTEHMCLPAQLGSSSAKTVTYTVFSPNLCSQTWLHEGMILPFWQVKLWDAPEKISLYYFWNHCLHWCRFISKVHTVYCQPIIHISYICKYVYLPSTYHQFL